MTNRKPIIIKKLVTFTAGSDVTEFDARAGTAVRNRERGKAPSANRRSGLPEWRDRRRSPWIRSACLATTRRPTIRISGVEGPPPVSPDPISLLSDTRRPTIRISGVEGPPPVSPDPIRLLSDTRRPTIRIFRSGGTAAGRPGTDQLA
jgi:hypothetical protein